MKKLRVGIVGRRGASAINGLRSVEGVHVSGFCEINPQTLATQLSEHGVDQGFTSLEAMLDHVDAVCIGSPMHLHVPQAVMALQAGKHVLSEVTAAVSLDECWRLLDAVKSSGKAYMLAENYCYFEENILIRELARQGAFGELYFAEGEYVHEVRFLHHNPDGSPSWRAHWQVGMPGNTYITHELGPPMQWFKAQDPKERIESVVCMGSGVHTDPEHPHDDTSITLIKLASGKLIKVRLDMMSNTPGMVFYSLQGTTGTYESERSGTPARIWTGDGKGHTFDDPHRPWSSLNDYRDRLSSDWKNHIANAKDSGHGGGDYHTARLFAETCLSGENPDIDIYDSLEWTAAGLCSQTSIANGGVPIRVPNFKNPAERPAYLDSGPANP
jgi:predicted dehydrogenase